MYGNFTERSQRVMELAEKEALDLGHGYIDTVHILLGLLKEGSGIGATALQNLNVNPGVTKEKIRELQGPDTNCQTSDLPCGSFLFPPKPATI